MRTKRKKILVDELLKLANDQLARTDKFADQRFKAGVCVIIERVLLDTGNYKGYTESGEEAITYSRIYF